MPEARCSVYRTLLPYAYAPVFGLPVVMIHTPTAAWNNSGRKMVAHSTIGSSFPSAWIP